MRFNDHWNLEGKHAFLSPSQYHWTGYSEEKLLNRWATWKASERGTRLHALAKECIELKVPLKGNRSTLAMYVNDAIGFRMTPEVPLYFSEFCFGTADAISFDQKKRKLRIHDLKTGVTPASFIQLEVYAALFCLEYQYEPETIDICLRIYQNDQFVEEVPEGSMIHELSDKIIFFSDLLAQAESE